jgi:hypothetical protein
MTAVSDARLLRPAPLFAKTRRCSSAGDFSTDDFSTSDFIDSNAFDLPLSLFVCRCPSHRWSISL